MAFRIQVQVTPNAGRNEIVRWQGGRLKIKIRAPAVEGKANEELVRYLAEQLGIHRKDVRIERGETAKAKTILVEGIEEADAIKRLALSPK